MEGLYNMGIIKCKMCGGDLDIKDNSTIAKCRYCGSVQTVHWQDHRMIPYQQRLPQMFRSDPQGRYPAPAELNRYDRQPEPLQKQWTYRGLRLLC